MLSQAITRPRAAAAQGSCGLHGPHDTVRAAGASLSGAVAITVMEKAASSTSISGDMSLKLAVLGYTCRQHQRNSQEGPMAGKTVVLSLTGKLQEHAFWATSTHLQEVVSAGRFRQASAMSRSTSPSAAPFMAPD